MDYPDPSVCGKGEGWRGSGEGGGGRGRLFPLGDVQFRVGQIRLTK